MMMIPAPHSDALATLVISNACEAYGEFLATCDPSLVAGVQAAGERCLWWWGDRKLVLLERPITPSPMLARLGYHHTEILAPPDPTTRICDAIAADPDLFQRVLAYIGDRPVQLIPYSTTPALLRFAAALRAQSLTVTLPESPRDRTLRDQIESKIGLRTWLAAHCPHLLDHMPPGIPCTTPAQAHTAIHTLTAQGHDVILKPNTGFLGFGHLRGEAANPAALLSHLEDHTKTPPLPWIVEACIPSAQFLSPSAEFVIPPWGGGQPRLTQVGQQVFRGAGRYCGELLSRQSQTQPWYVPLITAGFEIAHHLQAQGYQGHFDLDSIVADSGELYLLEVNARRTGGTHLDDLARWLWGEDYLATWVLLSVAGADSGAVRSLPQLWERLTPWLYPRSEADGGVIVTHTAQIDQGRWGYAIAAQSEEDAIAIQTQIQAALG
jgi:hypothetical protein